MARYSIGLDFGTESVRAVMVDVDTGEIKATAVHSYADGVIDHALPSSDQPLPRDWALQNPADWLAGLQNTIHEIMHASGVFRDSVVGLGIDFTSCTILPTTADGTPLCEIKKLITLPHAWPKLWKHHGAQGQADRVNQQALERNESWLPRYGGKISSEWVLPKILEILEEAPEIYANADYFVEGADWVVWKLTGVLARNACGAGYKATWHKIEGFPSNEYLSALHSDLSGFYDLKYSGKVLPPGTRVGSIRAEWAKRLGLPDDIPIAAPIIDAHAASPGAGITEPGKLFMIMGTSTCHLLMAEREVLVPGISGVVEDGIVSGLFGYEAGQVGVGDVFAWFVRNNIPPEYHQEAQRKGLSLHDLLSEKAKSFLPGQSGLLALDWWNGCRTPLVDAELSGLLLGATLTTMPEEIYRALIEATAFGTRLIIESFTDRGIPVQEIRAGGGLIKNPFLMQIYADVTERNIEVTGASEVSALGAAMLGAVAAGKGGGGYEDLETAASQMASPPEKTYSPKPEQAKIYQVLYKEYLRLVDYFGRGQNPVMKVLRALRRLLRKSLSNLWCIP